MYQDGGFEGPPSPVYPLRLSNVVFNSSDDSVTGILRRPLSSRCCPCSISSCCCLNPSSSPSSSSSNSGRLAEDSRGWEFGVADLVVDLSIEDSD